MRLATYNVEWFTNLFDQDDKLVLDDSWSSRYNITKTQQINALGSVFKAVNADGVMIIEAPNAGMKSSCVDALEGFAKHFGLRQNKAVVGFRNDTQQESPFFMIPMS